jgi:hypothetical protein
MLYRSTDRLCRCGAPMKNLAHSASFESLDKNAPSNAGTKHLVNDSHFTNVYAHLLAFIGVYLRQTSRAGCVAGADAIRLCQA